MVTIIVIPDEVVVEIDTIEVCDVCGAEGDDHDTEWHEFEAGWVMDK